MLVSGPDEAQLADAPFYVDELEDSREGDNPSEAEFFGTMVILEQW